MRALGLALLILGLSGVSASAQTGLQRFENEIKPHLPLQSLTYSAPRSVGLSGFALDDVRIVIPPTTVTHDKEIELKIGKLVVEALDFDRLKAETHYARLPRFGAMRLKGVVLDDRLSGFLQGYGIPKGPIDLSFDYRLDPGTEQFTLSDLDLMLPGQARITLSFVLEGVSDKTNLLLYAKDVGRIRKAALTLDDHGLIAKVLPAIAPAFGLSPEAVIAIAKAFLLTATAGDPSGANLVAFLSDWKEPKGPLTLSIRPAEPMELADFAKVLEPGALSKTLGLVADYSRPVNRAGESSRTR